jgi:C4-dicarboxylate-specific signal transduction histidine kinase
MTRTPQTNRRRAASQLTVELRQSLTAASNYVATAQLLVQPATTEALRGAANCLEKAAEQILRAGALTRELSPTGTRKPR